MNDISKQYYEFLYTLQKIFFITNTKGIKVTKIDRGIICFQNEKDDNVEISTAHDVIEHCPNNFKSRELFLYDGVKIQPISKNYDKRYNNENINGVSLIYNEEEANFFSFIISCLAEDYKNPRKNKELKKTLNVTQIINHLEKCVTDPGYARKLYDYIDSKDLVQPLISTMGEIKNFLEQNKMQHFNRLSVDKRNKTISFGSVSKEITISQNDISTANENHYNIDYYGSILECLYKDIEFGRINTRQYFTVEQFYKKLLSYNKRFDCLVPLNSAVSTTEGQKTDKFTNVQKTSVRYSMLPSYTQNDYPLVDSSTQYRDLIPYKPNGNEQQSSTPLVLLATVIPGLMILFALIFAYCYCKKRNDNEVRADVETINLMPLVDRSKQNV